MRALPYSSDVSEPVATIALKLVVAVAAVVGCVTLIHAVSGLWVHFRPATFSGVGTWPRGTWQAAVGPALFVVSGVGNGLILCGASAFRARHRATRRLLLCGAGGVIVSTVGLFVMELLTQAVGAGAGQTNLRSAAVLMLWRMQWMTGPLTMPLLLILLLTRPEVKRWVADRPRAA